MHCGSGYDVATPANAPLGQIAWNSFGYVATRADNNEPLVPSEPRKVGLEVMSGTTPPENPPGISLVKFVNGIHAPNPPGPTIAAGAPVVFTYLVTTIWADRPSPTAWPRGTSRRCPPTPTCPRT